MNIHNQKQKILVTGCFGFIGSHLCEKLVKLNYSVYGIDNLNKHNYFIQKKKNLKSLSKYKNFKFSLDDIRSTKKILKWKPNIIINLASLAGVRDSLYYPQKYIDVNINGQVHLLNESVKNKVDMFIYASSSSVYGLNNKVPFSEVDTINKCNSPYACTKKSMEDFAKLYYQLYDLSVIGLRFFTVYGPRGRPDMAPYKFMKAILDETEFTKYGDGNSSRDYTYIDDIVDGIIGAIKNKNNRKCEIYNLGNSTSISLNKFIEICEIVCKKKAVYKQIENQLGDVPHTYADISKAKKDLDYNPKTKSKAGLQKLYDWLLVG